MLYSFVVIQSEKALEEYLRNHWLGDSDEKIMQLRLAEAKQMARPKFAKNEPLILRDSAVTIKELLPQGLWALFAWQHSRREDLQFVHSCKEFEQSDRKFHRKLQCGLYALSYEDIMPDAFDAWVRGVITTYDLTYINTTLCTEYENQFATFIAKNQNPLQFFDVLNSDLTVLSAEAKKYLLPYFTQAKTTYDGKVFQRQSVAEVLSEVNIEKLARLPAYQRQFAIIPLSTAQILLNIKFALEAATEESIEAAVNFISIIKNIQEHPDVFALYDIINKLEENIEVVKKNAATPSAIDVSALAQYIRKHYPVFYRKTEMEDTLAKDHHDYFLSLVVDHEAMQVYEPIIPTQVCSIIINQHEFMLYPAVVLGEIDLNVVHDMALLQLHPDIYNHLVIQGARVEQLYDVNTQGPALADNLIVSPKWMKKHDGMFHRTIIEKLNKTFYFIFIKQAEDLRKIGCSSEDNYLNELDDFFGIKIFLDWLTPKKSEESYTNWPNHAQLLAWASLLVDANETTKENVAQYITRYQESSVTKETIMQAIILPLFTSVNDIKQTMHEHSPRKDMLPNSINLFRYQEFNQTTLAVTLSAIDFIMQKIFQEQHIHPANTIFANYSKCFNLLKDNPDIFKDIMSAKMGNEGLTLMIFDHPLPNGGYPNLSANINKDILTLCNLFADTSTVRTAFISKCGNNEKALVLLDTIFPSSHLLAPPVQDSLDLQFSGYGNF